MLTWLHQPSISCSGKHCKQQYNFRSARHPGKRRQGQRRMFGTGSFLDETEEEHLSGVKCCRMKRRDYSESGLIFRSLQSSAKNRLGPLELQVLSVLRRRGSATVHEVIKYGDLRREYNTVMTTLGQLYRKQLVSRTKVPHSRAFRYIPCHTQAELEREVISKIVRRLLDVRSTTSLSYLVEAISEHDAGLLDDLQRLVNEKRQKLRGERSSDSP
jgi:predicted transcriptional regulator